ncbi:hypothetical protein L6452_33560 [Arctium lappa]|uniref:Uncharacterized protein n=1 Tax=Arctium lappa TaxID=4217 RepID=A0ACB8YF47_ARCLA|nr:hypothetical protein L6452_33560 [Arctium lappa]
MMAAAICRRLRPNKHRRLLSQSPTSFRQFSSSNSDDNHEHRTPPSQSQSQSQSQSSSSMSSYFNDVKASLRRTSPPQLPPRRSSLFDSNPSAGDAPSRMVGLDEIRKNLSEFRRSSVKPPTSSPPTVSFQELYKRSVLPQADLGSSSEDSSKKALFSMKSIRLSLKNQTTSSSQSQQPEVTGKSSGSIADFRHGLKLRTQDLNQKVPESIGKDKKDVVSDEMKREFVRMYTHEDLGKKLNNLRPEVKGSKKIGFSLGELSERLRKLRELDEEENRNRSGPVDSVLRESLYVLQQSQDEKKSKPNAAKGLSVLSQIVGTPNFMLSPPKEILVEKYFHPDHMSSSEKQKLQLKEVRDKFKMSESDCGSARVQVAQLTTKIKHLATVLHKKDKHSRKGLQAMVQKRKKLLKYLRRTDWDSYSFCLAELGLRDSTDYKL